MIAACFSQPTAVSGGAGGTQNLITCTYQIHLCNSPMYVTLTWAKTSYSHSLTIYSADSFSVTIPLNPSSLSFFRPRPGSKSIYLTHRHYQKIKLYWDFTRTEFDRDSAEPDSSFYVAISCDGKVEFFLGDLSDCLTRRTGLMRNGPDSRPLLLSTREHVFGHRRYASRAQFLGSKRQIGIECDGGVLRVKVDDEIRLVVRRLSWKFRGNEKIHVGGVEVEFFWDVFNWVRDAGRQPGGTGHGVFVFHVGDGGVWPEMMDHERRFMRKSLSASSVPPSTPFPVALSPATSSSSVLQWAEESSDCGRSSCSSSTTKSGGSNGGFSLLLYAWRRD